MARHNAAPTPTGFAEMIHDESSIPQSHRPLHQQRSQQRNRLRQIYTRPHDAVTRVYDAGGNVIETHEHKGDFKEW